MTTVASLVLLAMIPGVPLSGRTNPVVVWFTPGPGTADMLRLFDAPDEWPTTRPRVAIFKFYQGQTVDPAPAIVGPNSYQALRAAGAFRVVSHVWHKRIALEVAAVKPFYCTADDSGMNQAIRDTLAAIEAVRQAGGQVNYLALDEPFATGGLTPPCGGPDLGPTFTRLQRYYANIHLAAPEMPIGLIEPYPTFSTQQLLDIVRRMVAQGTRPAFFHLDADLNAVKKGRDTFTQDLQELSSGLAAMNVRFGVIFWGLNGDSDALYCGGALELIRRTNEALPELPHDVIFQSWAESRTGLRITPTNLPEWTPNTHTNLIAAGLALLRR